tara:strand:- start:157 stop:987 length:831 start_codon:yes stop_codon:yes gene_type:complete
VANVTRVIDGDTVEVLFLDGSTDTVRLLGVDTPETFGANRPDEYGAITDIDCLDAWGSLATDFAVRVLQGQTVTVIKDPAAGERGFYGRLLAYIHVDGQDFNATLVEQGYARVYIEGKNSREGDYLVLQERAQMQRIGFWGCESHTPVTTPTATVIRTVTVSRQQIVIECVFYDGLVSRTEADEYVQIANVGEATVDLAGWRLVDIADGTPSLRFPSYTMMPGAKIRVYTNQRHLEWGGFSFGKGRAVWNNRDPDVAALFDDQRQEVSRRSYPPGC